MPPPHSQFLVRSQQLGASIKAAHLNFLLPDAICRLCCICISLLALQPPDIPVVWDNTKRFVFLHLLQRRACDSVTSPILFSAGVSE